MRVGITTLYITQTLSLVHILVTDLQSTVIDISKEKK